MTEVKRSGNRLSLPAIAVGALAAFMVSLCLMSLNTGIAMFVFHIELGQNITGVGYATMFFLTLFKSLFAFSIGGYVAGYFSPQDTLFESRMHGFAAFALAGMVLAFYTGSNGGSWHRNTTNATLSYVVSASSTPDLANSSGVSSPSAPRTIPAGIPISQPGASKFLTVALFMVASAATAYWAGGEAYLRRRRRSRAETSGEEARAA